ncbi:MAG: radical SAM protein [Candidatus Omnitrophica bacterium]|nr:radical SAM protein [Candidatus Omnitrophota bacterium]
MISISKLYCDENFDYNELRYGIGSRQKTGLERKPIVVWNVTRTCNLNCIHCYTSSTSKIYSDELTTDEGKALIDDLAVFGVPSLLFSGGEPLMRKDIFELIGYATTKGIRTVISTNGTLIDQSVAKKLKELNISYVGISLDGIGDNNDKFRGSAGAFKKTEQAFKYCQEAGLTVGLRLTLTRHNYIALPEIFSFIDDNNIPRVCFYHLAYSGRGENISDVDLTHEETRKTIDFIMAKSKDYKSKGIKKDILTVANHVDGVYLYLKLLKENPERANKIFDLLKWNGGGRYSEGVGIGCVDFFGNIHPSQFWMDYSFGNVKDRSFMEIWTDDSDTVHKGLRDRLPLLKGKCSKCKFIELCGGSLRGRAKSKFDDIWMEDPACYLTEEEISGS